MGEWVVNTALKGSKSVTHFPEPAEGAGHFEELIASINIFNKVPFC